MKKLISAILCIVFAFTLLPGIASAEAKSIQLNSVVANSRDKSVTVSGNLSRYAYSPWRKDITVGITVIDVRESAESAQEDNSKIFHVDEIGVDQKTGTFTYSFVHNSKEANDECKIILSCEGYTAAQAVYSMYNEDAQIELLAAHNIAAVDSPLYYVNSIRSEAEKTPYKENGNIYIPLEILAALTDNEANLSGGELTIGGNVFDDPYVSDAELSAAGVSVSIDYETGVVYTGASLSEGEIKNIIPVFGIHVSKNGSDSNSGSVTAPVSSITRALEIYHSAKENNFIFVHSGTYSETIVIDENYSDLKLRALGNVELKPSHVNISRRSFTRVTDPQILEMLPDKSRGMVLSAPVSGLTDTTTSYKVFAQGKEQPISRFPSGDGFAMADGGAKAGDGDTVETLYYHDKDRLTRWNKDPEARVLLFRSSGYVITKARINSTDIHKNAMYLTWEGSKPYQEIGKRFFVYDTITEIDMPGEWYIDKTNQRIYYYPTDDFEELQIITGLETPLTIRNTSNITIDGFTVKGARKVGVAASSSDGVNIINTTVENVGTTGINATLLTNSRIENCVIKETGEGALRLNYKDFTNIFSNGSDPDLRNQGNVVKNNRIHHVGLINPISGAVYFGGKGNTFEYNTVHDTPHMGIWFLGNDNIIQYNEFYNALKHCDDAGVIYGNPSILGFGNVIRYNIVRSIKSLNPEQTELYMIYLDSDTSGTTVRGNIFDASDSSSAAAVAMIGGGRNNVVEENIIIGNKNSYCYMSNRYNYNTSGTLHKGLLSSMSLYQYINQLTYSQRETWFTNYPQLEEEYGYYVEYAKGDAGSDPKGTNIGVARDCVVRNNIVVSSAYPNGKTDIENRNTVFNPPSSTSGIRYDAESSTGNIFVSTYDTSGAEAMKAGSKLSVLKDTDMYFITPKEGDVLKTGPNRFVWNADGEALHYEVTLYDVDADEILFEEETTERFIDIVLKTGNYEIDVESVYADASLNESCTIPFECRGGEIDMIASLDLSRNPLTYRKNDTGTIKVYATDYSGSYINITGNSALTYTSSDPNVITVGNDGSYTVQGAGNAVVTVSTGNTEKSMVVWASVTNDVLSSLSLDNYTSYVDTSTTVLGTVERIEDPTGDGYALKETMENSGDKPQLFSNPVIHKTYVMGIWVYDNLSRSIRFGIQGNPDKSPKLSPQVYYGVKNTTDNVYQLYHVNDEPEEVKINLSVPRTQGWHQIFMAVEYDETAGQSYVEFYFDGQLVVRMVNNSYITPRRLEQGTAFIKERIVAKNLQSAFTFVSTSVDGEKVIEPQEDIVLLFNKALNPEETTVRDLYFLSSDESVIEALARYEDKTLILTPSRAFVPGEEYTLKIDADFVNLQTTLVEEKTVKVKTNRNFSIREDLKIFTVEETHTTSGENSLLEVNVTSHLKEGKQSMLLILAVKDPDGVIDSVTVETLTLNPLETVSRDISGNAGSILEAFILDNAETLIPLHEKITNVKE